MDKNYYTLNQAFEMVANDCDSGSEPEYSDQNLGTVIKFYNIFW